MRSAAERNAGRECDFWSASGCNFYPSYTAWVLAKLGLPYKWVNDKGCVIWRKGQLMGDGPNTPRRPVSVVQLNQQRACSSVTCNAIHRWLVSVGDRRTWKQRGMWASLPSMLTDAESALGLVSCSGAYRPDSLQKSIKIAIQASIATDMPLTVLQHSSMQRCSSTAAGAAEPAGQACCLSLFWNVPLHHTHAIDFIHSF